MEVFRTGQHDIRINKDLIHPSKEFFDDMWSLKEYQ